MKIALGSDHAGFHYKAILVRHLLDLGHEVVDFGTDSEKSVDYPDYIRPAAEAVARGECERVSCWEVQVTEKLSWRIE